MASTAELEKDVVSFVGYLQRNTQQETAPYNTRKESLSKQFAGALRLSDTAYEALQNSLQESRSEWNRNIF